VSRVLTAVISPIKLKILPPIGNVSRHKLHVASTLSDIVSDFMAGQKPVWVKTPGKSYEDEQLSPTCIPLSRNSLMQKLTKKANDHPRRTHNLEGKKNRKVYLGISCWRMGRFWVLQLV